MPKPYHQILKFILYHLTMIGLLIVGAELFVYRNLNLYDT